MAAGEGVEPPASESKSDVLPVTLSRKNWSRRKESNLRLSIIDRVHCRLCYTAMVDPTGLKPAPHGLKGRCSVTRAPDRKRLAVAEGLEPSIAGLTIRCLTNLATPQNIWLRRRESNSYQLVYKTSALDPIELRRKNLVDREGLKPSQEVCRTSMLSLHHQPEFWWLRVESNHQPGAYETPALPVELHSRIILEARGGVEPRAFPPSSSEVRFRRPMPGTRATVLVPKEGLKPSTSGL